MRPRCTCKPEVGGKLRCPSCGGWSSRVLAEQTPRRASEQLRLAAHTWDIARGPTKQDELAKLEAAALEFARACGWREPERNNQ